MLNQMSNMNNLKKYPISILSPKGLSAVPIGQPLSNAKSGFLIMHEKCKWCNSKAYKKQGRIWLCVKHYRFSTMRGRAKTCNKEVPTYDYLENRLRISKMKCEYCHIKMNWLAKNGQKKVMTLQHDRSGLMRFLCRSCNAKHGSMPENIFYTMNHNTHRYCQDCRKAMLKEIFFKDNFNPTKRKSYCKKCSTKRVLNWRNNNKKYYNEKQKEYRAKRKAENNQIITN